MAKSANLEIINHSTTKPALNIDDRGLGGNIVIVKRERVPVVWIDADGALHCSAAIVAPDGSGGVSLGSGAPAGSPGDGPRVYVDTATGTLYTWGGAAWAAVGGGGGGPVDLSDYEGDVSLTSDVSDLALAHGYSRLTLSDQEARLENVDAPTLVSANGSGVEISAYGSLISMAEDSTVVAVSPVGITIVADPSGITRSGAISSVVDLAADGSVNIANGEGGQLLLAANGDVLLTSGSSSLSLVAGQNEILGADLHIGGCVNIDGAGTFQVLVPNDEQISLQVTGGTSLELGGGAAALTGASEAAIAIDEEGMISLTGGNASSTVTAAGDGSAGIDASISVSLSVLTQRVDLDSASVALKSGSTARIKTNATGIGFFAANPVAKPTVTGSRGGNAALASLLTALADLGLITNSSS